MFFDLETTGLSGGSGTVAFVVGVWLLRRYPFPCLAVRAAQFPRASDACWRLSTAAVARAHTLVTFNGKSFDVPFMEMRWLYQRLETPLPALRHLDLLHPSPKIGGDQRPGDSAGSKTACWVSAEMTMCPDSRFRLSISSTCDRAMRVRCGE